VALAPPAEPNLTPYLSVDGRVNAIRWIGPGRNPWQPKWGLMNKRMDLTKAPGPGSALEESLYLGEAGAAGEWDRMGP